MYCASYRFVFAALASLPMLCQAQFPAEKGPDGWTIEIGLGIEREPVFAGSDKAESEVNPYLNLAYRRGRTVWYTTGTDVGAYYSINDKWLLGASAGLELGREEGDHEDLTGLGDIDDTVEVRVDTVYRVSDSFSIGARAMTAGAGKDEVYFLAGIYTPDINSQRIDLKIIADASWGSAEHLTTEFGVTPQQSANSGLPVYQPDSGLKSIGLTLSGRYWINDQWFSYASFGYESLGKAAKDSPFVRKNSVYEVGLGVGYRF